MSADNTASTPDAARGAILPASDAPGGYADADVLKGLIAALDRESAENERLRAEVERWREKAQEAGEAYANANTKHHAELDRANRLERLADTLAEHVVELEDRAWAAEAKLRDVEVLLDSWSKGIKVDLTMGTPKADVEPLERLIGHLRAVLARSQAPQAPAEQEGCSTCGQQMDSPGCCKSPGREGAFHTVSGGVGQDAPSVRPAMADDETP